MSYIRAKKGIATRGFEPPTVRVWAACSTRLSYVAMERGPGCRALPRPVQGRTRSSELTPEKKSGWVYAYRTFWVDPGSDWDERKVAEFLELQP